MKKPAWKLVCAIALASASAPSTDALACSASQNEVYRSTKSVWCVEKSIVTQYGAFPARFFPFGDDVVDQLVALFKVPAEGIYTFEASKVTGGAHTGSECCNLGVTVTGDAFYNNAYGSVGFWGYLLALHEMINDFTGQVSSGWPTDFWADHISAFPNSMDWHIMEKLGTKNNDANLLKASVAQKKRFYPNGDSADPRVVMFDKIFDLPNYGFEGLSRVFGYIEADKLSWENLGVANPDRKRTEYVMAFLSLGTGTLVTPIMKAAHVGDGSPSGAGDPGYVVSDANIDKIASAHCAIAAAGAQGQNVTAARTAFRAGNYAGVTVSGTCAAGCPAECGCKKSENKCTAPWLGDPIAVPDAGTPPVDAGTPEEEDDAGDGPGDVDAGSHGGNNGGGGGVDGGASPGGGKTDGGSAPGGNDDTGDGDPGATGGCGAAPGSSRPIAPYGAAIVAVGGVAILARRRRRR
jgi:hypothetical protein